MADRYLSDDDEMVVWWGTPVECVSAISRLRREGGLDLADCERAERLLRELEATWYEVQATRGVRRLAVRALRVHSLSAADALQLAAALEWAGTPSGDEVITFDSRLAGAARLEGFTVPEIRG